MRAVSDYLLPLLTVSAATLAVAAVAVVYLLPPRPAARRAPGVRWIPIFSSALLVGAATAALGVLAGASGSTTAAAGAVLAASVALHAPLSRSWPVRGVTAWALLAVAGTAVLVSVAEKLLASGMPWEALVASALGTAVLVSVLGRAHRRLRTRLGIRAGVRRAASVPVYLRPALMRPGLALGVFFAAFTVAGLTEHEPSGERGRAPGNDRAVRPTGPHGTQTPSPSARLVSSVSTGPAQRSGPPPRGRAPRSEATADQTASGTEDRSDNGGISVASRADAAGTERPTRSAAQPTSASPSPTPRTASSRPSDAGTGEGNEQPVDESTAGPLAPVTEPVEETLVRVEETLEPLTAPVQEPAEATLEPVTAPVEDALAPVGDAIGSALP